MTYTVRTIDRCFTEAHYSSMAAMVEHWANEIITGTHYFIVSQ
jgi:hypothetical protein